MEHQKSPQSSRRGGSVVSRQLSVVSFPAVAVQLSVELTSPLAGAFLNLGSQVLNIESRTLNPKS
jgi:hypothetical protein